MILQQFYLACLAHGSYLIGDETTGTAVVVDPQRDIEQYLEFAESHGLRITHVFLTHFHADFIAGHLELRQRVGATICLGAAAKATYPFDAYADGDVLELGRVSIRILETPGHTPESISLVVSERQPGDAGGEPTPYAVLTGDTLFVGDVGRPDLRAALGWSADALGGLLYDSLHTKLLPLPDASLVYPAHGAGSLCGKAIGSETFTTVGEQRRVNYALQPMSKAQFIELVTADQPDAPAYFTYDAVLNSQERPTLDRVLADEMKALTLRETLQLADAGAQLLDTRDPGEFAAAHLAGSINIGLGGQYATWAGTLLDHAHPIVIIADPGREGEAAVRLGRIGFDRIAGYLDGGMQSLVAHPALAVTTERVSAPLAAEQLAAAEPPLVIDVRTAAERAEGRIAGSVGIPLSRLVDQLDTLPTDREILVYCAGGYRSSIAASLLRRDGLRRVREIAGGIAGWDAAKLPVETAAETAPAVARHPDSA
jgi:glyoxylase-like metal-dependent hydrolase (beta-lactamase superfamily II)/rhodanese-related sulfurtransferase